MNDDWKRAMTSLLIRALRPILVPLIIEALEQHTKAYPTLRTFYVGGRNVSTWQ